MKVSLCSYLLLVIGLVNFSRAEHWPNFRGPSHNGISLETGWLDHWPAEGPSISWKTNVGTGLSSFAVAGNRVFTIGNHANTDAVFCFDADNGKELWRHSYESDLGDKFFEGGPTSTPTVDGRFVYTLSRWGDLFCFEAASGKIIWSKNVQKETQTRIPGWGFSGSPLVRENLLVLNVGEAGMALDKATGNIIWRSATKDCGYSTPLPIKFQYQWTAILASGQSYLAVDLKTGAELWRIRWLTQFALNAAEPVVDKDKVFISSGYGKGCALLAMKAGEPDVVWKSKVMRNQFNSSVLLDGFLYGIDGDTTEKARLKCIEYATGTEKWSQPGIGSGALMVADGKLIVLSDSGELLVAPASNSGFKPTARTQVLGGKCWTTPVLANGRIYCRNSRGDIVCIDARASAK
jgi:outer membrane protein assembly factor BamB